MLPPRLFLSLSLRVWFLCFRFPRSDCRRFGRIPLPPLHYRPPLSHGFTSPLWLAEAVFVSFFPSQEQCHPCLAVWSLPNILPVPSTELPQPENAKSAGPRSQGWGSADTGCSCDAHQGDLKAGSFKMASVSQEQTAGVWAPVWLCQHAKCPWLPAQRVFLC